MIHIGIDEAGRGALLGPLVMAAVGVTSEKIAFLSSLGVKDSKLFGSGEKSHARRMHLLDEIREHLLFTKVVVFDPATIDKYVQRNDLNSLEREGAVMLLEDVKGDEEIVCDGEDLFSPLRSRWPNLKAENKADVRHVSVSIASIVAKTTRDSAMEAICQKYEQDFGKIVGGGYVNHSTRDFLLEHERRYGVLPVETRKSWNWRPEEDLLLEMFG